MNTQVKKVLEYAVEIPQTMTKSGDITSQHRIIILHTRTSFEIIRLLVKSQGTCDTYLVR